MLARQQDVKQQTQRVDVRRSRDRPALDLLGCRIGRCHSGALLERQRRDFAGLPLGFEQLGDAEVEQFRVAVSTHEHIGRLDVAVDDPKGVSVRDGAKHFENERNPFADAELSVVAILIDRLAIDVLEHEIRLAVGRDARIDEVRDIGMSDAGEDVGLATESRVRAAETNRQQLDGRESFELTIATLGEPDDPHPAMADRRNQPVGADGSSRELSWRPAAGIASRVAWAHLALPFEEAFPANDVVLLEQAGDIGRELGILLAKRRHPLRALLSGQLERVIQARARRTPSGGVHLGHVAGRDRIRVLTNRNRECWAPPRRR